MKNSIRLRLMIVLMVSIGTLMLSGVGTIYVLVHRALLVQFDQSLLGKARLLTLFPEVDRGKLQLEFTEFPLPEFERPETGEYYQLWMQDGTFLAKSRSLEDAELVRLYRAVDLPVFKNIRLPDGHHGRAVGLRFFPVREEDSPPGLAPDVSGFEMNLVMARDRTALDHLLADMRVGILTISALLLVLIGWIIHRTVKTGLEPVNGLARAVEALDAGSLDAARIDTEGIPVEIQPIATELNRMIGRLHEAFMREKRLTSDIAHELNTPLSELRAASEVALKWPDDPEATGSLAQQTRDTVVRLQNVVSELLELARQQHASAAELQPVHFADLWTELRRHYTQTAQERQMTLRDEVSGDFIIQSNPVLLRMVLGNLLENAIEYSPTGAKIDCCLTASPKGVVFVIQNPNQVLVKDDLTHLFDPLWRHDLSRTGSQHSGLGLSLVKIIADRLGIQVQADLPDTGTFRITLNFPAAGG
jgi:two-component system sensor histidine kinase QseC